MFKNDKPGEYHILSKPRTIYWPKKCFIQINPLSKGKLSLSSILLKKKIDISYQVSSDAPKYFQISRCFEYNAFCEHERFLNCWSLFPGPRICFGCFLFPRRHHIWLFEFLDDLTTVSALAFTGEINLHHLNQIVIFHWIYWVMTHTLSGCVVLSIKLMNHLNNVYMFLQIVIKNSPHRA